MSEAVTVKRSSVGLNSTGGRDAELHKLKRQYFALYPAYLLVLPPSALLVSPDGQTYLLEHLLGFTSYNQAHDISHGGEKEGRSEEYGGERRPPREAAGAQAHGDIEGEGQWRLAQRVKRWKQPEDSYRRKVWRRVIDAMEQGLGESEDEDAEIDERFYELLADLMVSSSAEAGSSSFSAPKPSYRTFIYEIPSDYPLISSSNISGEATSLQTQTGTRTQEESRHSHTHDQLAESSITLLEEQIAIQGGTTGLRTWTAALHLGHHLIHHPSLLFPTSNILRTTHESTISSNASSQTAAEQKQPPTNLARGVIELGAGTGFISVLLAQLGVDMVATDLGEESGPSSSPITEVDPEKDSDPQLRLSRDQLGEEEDHMVDIELGADEEGESRTPLGRLHTNVGLNQYPATKPSVRALDWTDAALPLSQRPEIWRLLDKERRTVVAADVIYDPDLVPPLVETISTLLGERLDGQGEETEAIISATIRNEDTFNLFVETCQSQLLDVKMIQVPPMDNSDPTFWDSALDLGSEVRIMRITRST